MRQYLLLSALGAASLVGVMFVLAGNKDAAHCGPCLIQASAQPNSEDVIPEKSTPNCSTIDCCRVVDVTNLPKAFAAPAEPSPFISFDEPPLARSTQPISTNVAPAQPPRLAVVPTAYEENTPKREVAPLPRKVD